jgi:hypothetical protein
MALGGDSKAEREKTIGPGKSGISRRAQGTVARQAHRATETDKKRKGPIIRIVKYCTEKKLKIRRIGSL